MWGVALVLVYFGAAAAAAYLLMRKR